MTPPDKTIDREDHEFLQRIRDEHPVCRAQVEYMMKCLTEFKEDFEQIRDRLPSRHPWTLGAIVAVISILSTATFMYTAMLVPMGNRLTSVETRIGESVPAANIPRIDALEKGMETIKTSLQRIELSLAKAGLDENLMFQPEEKAP